MNMHQELIRQLMHMKKYEAVTEFAKIKNNTHNESIVVTEYVGDVPRLMKRNNEIRILCPKEMTVVQENGIADSIENGTIFDDAENVENHAEYIERTVMPMTGIGNKIGSEPKKLTIILSGIVGRIGDDGRIEITIGDMENGRNFLNDLFDNGKHHEMDHVNKTCDHYMGMDNEPHESMPLDIRRDISELTKEIDNITDVDPEDTLNENDYTDFDDHSFDDYKEDDHEEDNEKEEKDSEDEEEREEDEEEDEEEYDDDDEYEESYIGEGFFSKKPKKLKPIPRDVIAYITVEINSIQDTNDQAMLAGYTSSKLELVDFYLNCIDTQDPRYIVPHTKQYLTQMQDELNSLLQRILNIRPINKMDRIWRGVV